MIKQIVTIPNASAQDIYDVLMDSKKHTDLIGDSAKVEAKEGGAFSTFSGYATGKTRKLISGKLIEQTWRASDWDKDIYSNISFRLEDTKEGAKVTFTQKDLPKGTQQEFESGWQDNYWLALKEYFK